MINLTDDLYSRISNTPFCICAIIQTGSSAFAELVDEQSDLDLVVLVEDAFVIQQCLERYKIENRVAHWTYISLDIFMNYGNPDDLNIGCIHQNNFCYSPVTLDALLHPLYSTPTYNTYVKTNTELIQNYNKTIAYRNINSNKGYIFKLLSEKYSLETRTKTLYRLILSYCQLENLEDSINWEQLKRIKRCMWQPLLETDIQFVDEFATKVLKYVER